MKLIRLKINSEFRGIHKGFEVNFFDLKSKKDPFEFNPYCLVGRNGSGKSNVLEALANIFYHIECIYLSNKPKGFEKTKNSQSGFDAAVSFPDAFEIEYLIRVTWRTIDKSWNDMKSTVWNEAPLAHIKITKKPGLRPEIEIVNSSFFSNREKTPDRTIIKEILPELVIGYSSGENEVLSLPFFKMRFIHYDEYADILTKAGDYKNPDGSLIYVDNQYSQAILLCNFLMQDKKYLKAFTDKNEGIGIEGVEQFRIIIQKHHFLTYQSEVLETLPEEQQKDKSAFKVELSTLISKTLDDLKACSTSSFEDKENMYLDYSIDDATRNAFQRKFTSPLALFRAFQVLHTLNLYDVKYNVKKDLYDSSSLYVNETIPILPSDKRVFRIKEFTIKKRRVKEPILTKSLSDGEHQFLHTMGICLLIKGANALFLLDEPETHFNPDWRSRFISTLKKCLEDDQKIVRDILITTHSPFIISDCQPENVLWFKREAKTELVPLTFNTFGASVNYLTLKLFEKSETISDLAKNRISELYEDFKNGKDSQGLIDTVSKEIGDSVEKILFINHILENTKK